jgi:hypothetical protein
MEGETSNSTDDDRVIPSTKFSKIKFEEVSSRPVTSDENRSASVLSQMKREDFFSSITSVQSVKMQQFESELFEKFSRKRGNKPRKEYVKIKILRGFKKALRELRAGKLPRKALHRFRANDAAATTAWQRLKTFFHQFSDILDKKSSVAHEGDVGHKSFNDNFLR